MKSFITIFKKALFVAALCVLCIPHVTHALTLDTPTPVPLPPCAITSFTATPNPINAGDVAALTWTTTKGCKSVTLNGASALLNQTMGTGILATTQVYTLVAAPLVGLNCGRFIGSCPTSSVTVVVNPNECTPTTDFVVKLTSATPRTQGVVAGKTAVKFAEYSITACKGGVQLESLQSDLLPLAQASSVQNLRLMNGATQASSVIANPTNSLYFYFPTKLPFAANETKTLSVVGDVKATAPIGSQIYFRVKSMGWVPYTSGSSIKYGNVISNIFTVTSPTACAITSFDTPDKLTKQLIHGPTISWSTSNCTRVWITRGFDQFGPGTMSLPLQGTSEDGGTFPFISYDTTYDSILTATDGINIDSIPKEIPVLKFPPATMPTCVINSFGATPNPVAKGGTITFNWSTTNCLTTYILRQKAGSPIFSSEVVGGATYGPSQTTATTTNTGTPEEYILVAYNTLYSNPVALWSSALKSIIMNVK